MEKITVHSTSQQIVSDLAGKVGNKTLLADCVGLKKSAISTWDKHGVPLRHVKKLEQITGIHRSEIHPEICSGCDFLENVE